MSKPLELKVFPTFWLSGRIYSGSPGYPTDVDEAVAAKRLTDAELAAEWHANESEAWIMAARHPEHYDADRAYMLEDRESILRRFARLPHYDEELSA